MSSTDTSEQFQTGLSLATKALVHRPRKGHKKSRAGCFGCKKRKVKCQETHPACGNCIKMRFQCVYPTPKTLSPIRISSASSLGPRSPVSMQGTPTSFSLADMRIFHHYLFAAYPHLPIGNDSTWLSEVPRIAHHNEYLMHAVLGMAASHLALLTGEKVEAAAIQHRVIAIKGVNEALSHPRRTGSDGDALLAACYLIAFQSSYMRDGLLDFFRTIRGCQVVSSQLQEDKLPTAFSLTQEVHFDLMKQRLKYLPVVHEGLVVGAMNSLLSITPFLDRPTNITFYHVLLDSVKTVSRSSIEAYFKWIGVYHFLLRMENDQFSDFILPNNLVARILMAHFFAIQLIISPIVDSEWSGRPRATPVSTTLDWISSVVYILPAEKKHLTSWPCTIAGFVKDELLETELPVSRISILRKKEGYNLGVF